MDKCKLCLVEGPDKRTLRISCLYDITEVVPEMERPSSNDSPFFKILICKACRASLLDKLEAWRKERINRRELRMDHDGNLIVDDSTRNIPVRVNGTVKMMTMNEFLEHQKKFNGDVL